MSDPDAMPDPIDKAYVEAESMLSDGAARSARRARVLAAVARRGAPDAAEPAVRPRLWRRGGWLVAASVSGLGLVIVSQLYRPAAYPPPVRPLAVPAAPVASPEQPDATPVSPVPAQVRAPTPRAAPRAARALAPTRSVAVAPLPAPPPAPPPPPPAPSPQAPPSLESAAPPPPRAAIAESEQAQSVQAANQPKAASGGGEGVSELVVTSEKRESRQRSVANSISAFLGRSRDVLDPGARLRAAAATDRTKDLEILLQQGAPVDSADAEGDTALMKSIQADHPDAAALLRRYGASLDRKNHAGETARGMASAKGDPDLTQALGLSP